MQLSGHNTVGQQLPALLDELGGRVFKQLACYTMKYQESDLHLGPYSSLTSANNNVGSCWPTMLRPFGRGFSLLGLRHTSLVLLKKLMQSKALVLIRMKLRNAHCLLVHLF